MNHRLFFIGLAVVGLALTACQSNTYKISGTSKELKDGDIVYLTTNMDTGEPKDSAVVKDGKFAMQGTATDTPTISLVYAKNDRSLSVPFFIEAGNISLTLSSESGQAKVYGTFCNNKWQEMNDSANRIAKRMEIIYQYVYNNNLKAEEQAVEMAKVQKLEDEFYKYVLDFTNKNIGNEFGYFMVSYNIGTFSPKDHMALLSVR